MPRIETYTANLASARGSRGQVGAEIDVRSATEPARALGNLGETIQRSALTVEHIGAIQEQRQKEQELRWATDESTTIKDELIKWQQENHTREDFGEAYREFADDLLAKRGSGAANTRAMDALKARVMPTIQSDWETALKTGERTRLLNFRNGIVAGATKDGDAFRFRYGLNHTEDARDILSSDIQDHLDTIGLTYGRTMPGEARSLSEAVVVAGVQSALEVDPVFAKEILDGHSRHVDPQTRAVLLKSIEAAGARINSTELENIQKGWQDMFADAAYKKTTLPPLDMRGAEALISDEGNRKQFVEKWKGVHQIHNEVTATMQIAAPLNPQERNRVIAEAGSKVTGVTGDKIRDALAIMDAQLDAEFKADSAGYVTRHVPEISDAYEAWQKSGRPEDEEHWRDLMWQRLGPPPSKPDDLLGILSYPSAKIGTYHNLPEGQRRYLLSGEAKQFSAKLTEGGSDERLQAAAALTQKFPDERKRAVAIKDIEQLSDGKGHEIQRTFVASKLAETNPAAAKILLSGQGKEAFKALKPEQQKEIKDLLALPRGTPPNTPSWWLFAVAARGANYETQDLVSGYASAVEEFAALNYNGNASKSVDAALKTLIFDRVAQPVMTPSVGSSQGQPLLIGRSNGQGGIRTDAEIDVISARIGYAKQFIKAEDFPPQIWGTDNPAIQLQTIQQNGFWVGDTDNQGAILYLKGRDGIAFAPLKKDRTFARIRYADFLATQRPNLPLNLMLRDPSSQGGYRTP